MKKEFKLYDVIALLRDIPERGLLKGHVGTLTLKLATDVFEVDFADEEGKTIVMATVKVEDMIVIHHLKAAA